jgi:hypothetical protein
MLSKRAQEKEFAALTSNEIVAIKQQFNLVFDL